MQSDNNCQCYRQKQCYYSKPNKYPNKFDATVSTWLRCRPRHTSVCLRPPPCPALTSIVSFCPSIYLDCYKMINYYCDVTDNLSQIKKVLVDGGYTGQKFADEINKISSAEVEVVKRNELHTFSVLPKRWIVERSFGWLDECRRLWKNCERLLQNSFQMVSLAFILIILRKY